MGKRISVATDGVFARRAAAAVLTAAALLASGIVLRVAQFASGRSLWKDEAFLALNVTDRTIPQLFQPLDYNQAIPPGFLVVEKLLVGALGNSDYTLRLFPLVAGVASLFVFHAVARRCCSGALGVGVSLALFALSEPLCNYASEVKQYSTDVLIALLLTLAAIRAHDDGLTTVRRVATLGLLGAAAVWFSYPSVFVLAGIGASLLLSPLRAGDGAATRRALACGALWAASFAAFYWLCLRKVSAGSSLHESWMGRGAFMPFPPRSGADASWYQETFFRVFEYPGGFPPYLTGLAGLLALLGGFTLFTERRGRFFLLALPVAFTLLASALHKYPFQGRLLLFLAPALLLLVGAGVERMFRRETDRVTGATAAAAGATVVFLLFFPLLISAAKSLARPRAFEEIKPVMDYAARRRQPGDVVYLYYGAQYAFAYYAERYGFRRPPVSEAGLHGAPPDQPDDSGIIVGRPSRRDRTRYLDEVDRRLAGRKRVWVFFSHVPAAGAESTDEAGYIVNHLDKIGRRRDSFLRTGAAVYLYDLSRAD